MRLWSSFLKEFSFQNGHFSLGVAHWLVYDGYTDICTFQFGYTQWHGWHLGKNICWIEMCLIKVNKNQVIKVIKKLSREHLVSFWGSGALAHKCELEIFDQSVLWLVEIYCQTNKIIIISAPEGNQMVSALLDFYPNFF